MNIKTNSLVEILKQKSNIRDKGIFFILDKSTEKFVSYKEIYENATKVLGNLQNMGVRVGEKLIFQIDNNYDFINVFWACILGGIIPVPINAATNNDKLLKVYNVYSVLEEARIIGDDKILKKIKEYFLDKEVDLGNDYNKFICTDNIYENEYEAVVNKPLPDDIAFLQFSSGSTGEPKGVTLTHKNLITNMSSIIYCSGMNENDTVLSWLPLTHDMGLIGCHLTTTFAGINQYNINPKTFIRNPIIWLEKASEHKITLLESPNFGYEYIMFYLGLKSKKCYNIDLSNVRLIFNGAEPIEYNLIKKFVNAMKDYKLSETCMYTVYGLAEACLAVTFPPLYEKVRKVIVDRTKLSINDKVSYLNNEDDKNAAVFIDLGYPVKDTYVKICDENYNELGEEVVGIIYIKGDNVTKGYYKNNIATKKAIKEDNWLNTGDIGFIKDGRLIVIDRIKDVLFINGQNYYSSDIERIVQRLTDKISVVVSVKDYDKEKENIVIFILYKNYKNNKDKFNKIANGVKEYLSKNIGMQISEVIPIRKIPRTTSGKIQRFKLVSQYETIK